MAPDKTYTAVNRQLKGMGCELYEIGIRHIDLGMLNRVWNPSQIIKSLCWLKNQNKERSDIYIRPARSVPTRLVLIDDLNSSSIKELQSGPYKAAVIVQTSPNNYQAWVKLHENIPAQMLREVARFLAHKYNGDLNSADSAHYGRLAGFTNKKPKHVDSNGFSPFVLLESYNGTVCPSSIDLVYSFANSQRKETIYLHDSKEKYVIHTDKLKILIDWYYSFNENLQKKFGPKLDKSKADWIAAIEMFKKGYSQEIIENIIFDYSPDIKTRKGSATTDYVKRTVNKAKIWLNLENQGEKYTDIADILLSLTQRDGQQ